MKTEWDYSDLANAYLNRPDYSAEVVQSVLDLSGVKPGDRVCDVGAGVAHLTLMLASAGLDVDAVEPNDAMRANGTKRTETLANVAWFEGLGEQTGRPSDEYALVTFGSSFNVCDRTAALNETKRILVEKGWFVCLWNHRDLSDPTQNEIEQVIKQQVPTYGYGVRREDQTQIIQSSELFGPVTHIKGQVVHLQSISECVEAWRSHATLQRQAGENFELVVQSIEDYLLSLGVGQISVPFVTNGWMAQLRD